jgi:uncharacterized protein DUF4440
MTMRASAVAGLWIVVAAATGCERPAEPPASPPAATTETPPAAPVPAPPPAAAPQPPPAPAPTAEDFAALEVRWAQALELQDAATLEKLLAPEFLITGVGSTVADPVGDRAEWLANVGRFPWPHHDVSDVRVALAGDTAVVKCIWSGRYPPQSLTEAGGFIRFLMTDVWVRRDGEWRVLGRHSSLPRPE